MRCGECDGKGEVEVDVYKPMGFGRDVGYVDTKWAVCDHCDGTGESEEDEEMNKPRDLLSVLHRIERVASVIARDETLRRACAWNVMRTDEIRELAQMAARMVQEPLDNGK